MENISITTGDFIKLLWENFLKETGGSKMELSSLLYYGRKRFWLEDQDERYSSQEMNRRTAARIIHKFMKIELGFEDLEDIHKAEVLKDLYTCRVCANSIANVYLRKLMPSEIIDFNGETSEIFNMLKPVTKPEALEILDRMLKMENENEKMH